METKASDRARVELKASGDQWEVQGYCSTFSTTPDLMGDVVAPGAFLDSLAKRTPILLWQHQIDSPLGRAIEVREDARGLWGRFSIAKTDKGRDARELVAAGLVSNFSIGFNALEHTFRADGARVLKKIDLYECSLVTLAANESAVIESYKGYGRPTRETEELLVRVEEIRRNILLRQRVEEIRREILLRQRLAGLA
jgi:HK97 family phage prohead protease